jgi:Tol biopolymer transport system component/DNA-binding winged helix-turn-helix (wHTH) protein
MLNSDSVARINGVGTEDPRTFLFGLFELDARTGELRRNGNRVKLQEQPFQVLTQLLEKPGTVVTRDELRDRLWPADTFVDFDHSLNAAIRRLRDALGDSAENPTFVETVARRGYRFLAPVKIGPVNGAIEIVPPPESAKPAGRPVHIWWVAAGVASIVLVLIGLKLGLLLGRNPPPLKVHVSQLTANPAEDRVRAAAISRDGKYLAFFDETGFYLRQIDTGETHPLALPAGLKVNSISWFPDSVHMVVAMAAPNWSSDLWEVSTLSGSARKIIDDGWAAAVSPNSKEIAFIKGNKMRQQVWLADADGGLPRRLVGEEGDFFGAIAWSPDGNMLAYTRGRFSYGFGVKGAIELLDVHGNRSGSPSVSKNWTFPGLDSPLAWASDGRLIFSLVEAPPHPPDSNLWFIQVNSHGQRLGLPLRLTEETGGVSSISATADGKRIVYVKGIPQPDVYVARLEGRNLLEPQRLTLDDRQDLPFEWTPDGKEVIFTSDRTGIFSIYKQGLDQTVPEVLVRASDSLVEPRLSPDGTQLLYLLYPRSGNPNSSSPLMRVPLAGGTPQKVLDANWISNHQCAHAPATVCLYSVVSEGKLTFFTFDPMKGKGSQVFELKDELPQLYNWSFSPDGTTLAIAKGKWGDEEPRIHLISLQGGAERWLTIAGYPGMASLDWAADSKSLWAPASGDDGNPLLNIDLQGHARVMWKPAKKTVGWAIPSRDGKSMALYVGSSTANAYMLERQ